MARYRKVFRCRDCGKIYPRRIPQCCSRCGLQFVFLDGDVTGALETVKARRTITGRWKTAGPADKFKPEDIQHEY